MTVPANSSAAKPSSRPSRGGGFSPVGFVLGSPILWGGLLTWTFYTAIPMLPASAFLTRYFCGHPLAYVTGTLFFIGMAILSGKGLASLSEASTWRHPVLGDLPRMRGDRPDETADHLLNLLSTLSPRLRQTQLADRLEEVADYIVVRRSAEGLESHLRYLAELAADRLHASFALVRTITWAVPILGFLGTVIGITIAIANVTPEQLEGSIADVTGGLAVAFDTTALALGLSLVMVFCSFLVERRLSSNLDRVEAFGIRSIAPLFPIAEADSNPLLAAEREAASQLLTRTDALINRQTVEWEQSLEQLRERWHGTLQQQQANLAETLSAGVAASLKDHLAELEATREDLRSTLTTLWSEVRTDLSDWQSREEQRSQGLAEAAREQVAELTRLSESIAGMLGSQQQLVQIEAQLERNLETLQMTETLEQTLHSVTAAVHLLTTRTRPNAA